MSRATRPDQRRNSHNMGDLSLDPYRQIESATEKERKAWEALQNVEDPELPVSIVDLGLVYDISAEDDHVAIEMTLTYSGCPARELILDDVQESIKSVPFVNSVDLNLVYSPAWSFERVTEQGREALTEYGLAIPTQSSSTDATCQE